jgi:hypothetical protein
MTKIVFHLGDHKTGSTAIQSTLATKAYQITGATLLYPQAHRLQHAALARTFTDDEAAGQQAQRFAEIREEIEAAKPDFAVISAEHFEEVDPVQLKAAVEKHLPDHAAGARYIAYVRPHADRIASSFAERIKVGSFWGTMEEMHVRTLEHGAFYYAPRFQNWRDTFGPAFELRPLVRALLTQQDVVADLFSYVLGHQEFTLGPTGDSNESVSLENLAILGRFQNALRDAGGKKGMYRLALGWALSRRMSASAFRNGTKVQMHRDLAETVLQDYTEDAQALDAAFFTGTPMMDALRAAPGKAVDVAQSVELADHYSPREIYLIDLWVDQMAQIILKDPGYIARIVREDHRAKIVAPVDEGKRRAGPGKRGPGGRGRAARQD